MKNLRAEYYWRMRIALDPVHGDNLALPPGNELLADLCSARYKMLAGGVIQIEDKADIKERIGRSPDVGEAVLMAHLNVTSPAPAGETVQDIDTDIYGSIGKRRLWG